MAAIFLEDSREFQPFMLQEIYKQCEGSLPNYARPLFLRFPTELDLTSTFKHRKVQFVKEGFDPHKVADPLFYRNEKLKTYSKLDASNVSEFLTKSRL